MKIFENKSIFKKLIIVFLCILLLSFCMPKTVKAEDGKGGKLLNPIMSLFVSLGDGTMTLLQKIVLQVDESLIEVDTSSGFWAKVLVIVVAVVAVSVIIAATVLTAGSAGIATVAGIAAALKGTAAVLITIGVTTVTFPVTTQVVEGMLPDNLQLPIFVITPQEIFSNKIPLLDVDFFNPSESQIISKGENTATAGVLEGIGKYASEIGEEKENKTLSGSEGENETETVSGEMVEIKSTANELRATVSNWYKILRDLSLVALLSVLVYIGIRIIISSTSQDKAKYKQMLVDWIVAICLLFVMQYIMSFSNILVKKIIEIVDTTQVSSDEENEIIEPEVFLITDKTKVSKAYEVLIGDDGNSSNPYYQFFVDEDGNPAGSDATVLVWPAENFMQQARLQLQLLEDDTETYVAIGWKLIYVVLVIFTVIFLVTYVKRVIYMAFLTIIAPLVALTYPIDKINDGKAQAFSMWFREYIFNLLIQPFHLILYTILIGSAMEFASQNIIYVVVALFFMIPAEKLLRSFFGFEKAHTPGLLAGPAGAALMMTGMNKLLNKNSNSKSESSKSSTSKDLDNSEDESNLRFNDNFDKVGSMLNGESNSKDENEAKNKMPKEKAEQGQGEDDTYSPKNNAAQSRKQAMQNNDRTNVKGNGDIDVKESSNRRQNKKTNNKALRLAKSISRAGRYYGHKKLEKVGKRIQNSHPLRTGLKLYGGLAGAAAGAIIGGISGDPTKSAQYAMTGAMGTYKAMDGILPDFSDDNDWKEATNLAKTGYYGDEIDKHNMEKYIKNFKNNYDNQIELEKKLGSRKEAKEFMRNVAGDYIENGVTDIDDMVAGYQLEKDGTVSSRNMGIATVKYAKRVGSKPKDMKQKDKDEWHKTFVKEFENNSHIKNNSLNVDNEVDKVMKRINAFYDIKNK